MRKKERAMHWLMQREDPVEVARFLREKRKEDNQRPLHGIRAGLMVYLKYFVKNIHQILMNLRYTLLCAESSLL